ncbi:MAG TPA: phospholipase D-like domain-containing protein [Burkholderiales bacterium]|nr:phospholipase D-like domain-containing protein [Burkholderiales bacterium]
MLPLDPWAVSVFISVVHVALALVVSAHIVLTKPDVRAAIGWTGLVWLAPVIGSAVYAVFGINRLRRQAGQMRRGRELSFEPVAPPPRQFDIPDELATAMRPLARLVGTITGAPLTPGNTVELLANGDAAYPAMLAAIDGAQRSVALATYIFNRGVIADRFVEALSRAVARGVEVRVLIDSVGARYSRPSILPELRKQGINVARFLPTMPWRHPYLNLRNHRKLMVVDGATGFCGGLNIQDACMLSLHPEHPVLDTHFRMCGPVVGHMMRALAFDWKFTTREELNGPAWFPDLAPVGKVLARGIADGPDEDFETLLMTLLGALSQARHGIRIATPYFLPDPTLIDALRVAALRGVQVDILLPAKGNLRFVEWAATAQLSQIVKWGCRVYLSPPPFDHTKLFVVDDAWSLVGSTNWDPRSLRLNFEYAVECYSGELATGIARGFDAKVASARRVTVEELRNRSLPVKLRDGIVRLAQPYL